MIARICGSMSPAVQPCSTRAPTSVSAVGASAHSAEAAVKPAVPARNIRRRPRMSPSRPPVTSVTAHASVYPAMIH